MAFGLEIDSERTAVLQKAIQDELMKRGYSPDADPVMAEYITIMVINNKTPAQIVSELEDLIGSDFDATFVDWLFAEAAKGASPAEVQPAAAAAPAPIPAVVRDEPPHLQSDGSRRLPNGPRSGAPLYQQALSQAIPSTSPSGALKRSASARSPSPTGHGPNKQRRTDLPTGPRAMFRDGPGPQHGAGGQRSLLERVGGPARNGHGPMHDDIQARINNITSQSPDPSMMMMNGGFPMGMDMNAMANPLMLQEMMMNQMALMSQMAGAMGILNPAMNPGFPMQPGMGGDMGMFNPPMNGMPPPMDGGIGRGRGRGRGGPMRGGRGRGGQPGSHHTPQDSVVDAQAAPTPAASVQPAVAAPAPPSSTPSVVTAVTTPTPTSSRSTFVPPERPQSPTLCKFGLKCTNPACRWSHPSPVATAESGVVLSNEACENGKNCKDKDCVKAHVSPAVLNPQAAELLKPNAAVVPPPSTAHSQIPCKFGPACTRVATGNCPYYHPARPGPSHSKAHSGQPCRFGTACTRATCPFQHPEGRVLPSTFHRGLAPNGPIVNVPKPETGSMNAPSPHKSVTFNKGTASTAAELEKKLKEMEEKKIQAEKAVAQAEAAASKKDEASKSVPITA